MKKLLLIPLAIIMIAGLCFTGACGEKAPVAGSVLRVGFTTFSYETFDPIQGESFWGWQIFDPILTWDKDGNWAPALADSWTLSEDGLTWTFHVRQGVKFHNGDPLTSADFMWSVEHMMDPSSWNPWSGCIRNAYLSMECPDAATFVFKTEEPEPTLAMCFAATRVLPKNYIETNGLDYFREHPVGTGPWIYVDGSFVSGEKIEMVANLEHWRTVPHFEKLIQYVIPEEATQVAMLKRGELDMITGITLDTQVALRDEGFKAIPGVVPTGCNVIMPGTWLTDGPTGDIRVRQALAYAIDYEELCATFFHGLAEPGGRFFMYDKVWGWGKDWKPETYDLAKAQELLEEAGYPDAYANPEITIYIQEGTGYTPDLFQVIQGYWTAAGIQTKIEIVDTWGMLGMFFVPHQDDPTAPNIGAIFPWVYGDSYASAVYHSYNMYCPGGIHTTSNDQHALELYTKSIRELDPDLAEQYFTEYQAYCHDEMFINFGICLVHELIIVGDEVGDFGYGEWLSPFEGFADLSRK
jgi:peptide/nickel transport system substrate-binding protein